MKKPILLSAGVILFAFGLLSFSKEATKKYLVTREWMSDAYLQIRPTFYDYDDQGRQIRSVAQNPDTFTTTNTYTGSGILTVSHITTSTFNDTIKYTLGSNGRVTSDNRANTFTYDEEGKLLTGVDGEAYTWANGDLMVRTYYDGTKVHMVKYTYTTIPDMRDFGDAAWGMRSAHLVETVNDPPNTTTHRYTFDTQGRVTLDSAGANIYHYFYRDF